MSDPRAVLTPGTITHELDKFESHARTLLEHLTAVSAFDSPPGGKLPEPVRYFLRSHVGLAFDELERAAEKALEVIDTNEAPGWSHLLDMVPLVGATLDKLTTDPAPPDTYAKLIHLCLALRRVIDGLETEEHPDADDGAEDTGSGAVQPSAEPAPSEPVHRLTCAVFGVTHAIAAVGAKEGDVIVVRPDARQGRRALLQREIDPSWAFGPHARLSWREPGNLSTEDVHRELRERMGAPLELGPPPGLRGASPSESVTTGNSLASARALAGHGQALIAAAAAVKAAEADTGVLAVLRKRAMYVSEILQGIQVSPDDERPAGFSELDEVVWGCPVLALAAARTIDGPYERPCREDTSAEAWWWVADCAHRYGHQLVAWAEKHGAAS